MALLVGTAKATFAHVPNKGSAVATTDLTGSRVDGFLAACQASFTSLSPATCAKLDIGATKRHLLVSGLKPFEVLSIKGIELNNWNAAYVVKTVSEAVESRMIA
jgi:hypothetical protein